MKDEGGRMKERQKHFFHPSSFILAFPSLFIFIFVIGEER
jgi:hypothetical protein